MRYGITRLILLAAGIMVMISCSKERELVPEIEKGKPATLNFSMGSRDVTIDAKDMITSVRVIAFSDDGQARKNVFFLNNNPASAGAMELSMKMLSGIYNFVFVANENNGGEFAELAGYVGTKEGLKNVLFPAAAFDENKAVPMFSEVKNVTVLPGNAGVKVGGEMIGTDWVVKMKRLGVMIDMTLKARMNIEGKFLGVVFSNVPAFVPLIGNYSGDNFVTVTKNPASGVFDDCELTSQDYDDDYIWGKTMKVVLPSHLFSPKNTVAKALEMSVVLDGWSENPSTKIGFNEPSDYTLPPNTYFTGVGIVGPLLSVHLIPSDWAEIDINGDILGRALNVSALKKVLAGGRTERLYFNSNQQSVVIDPLGKNSGDADVPTGNIVNNPTVNYTYSPVEKTGTGYIDLKAANGVTVGTYRVYLNAGGLRREITVVVEN